jgi:osmotically-inducible protein OsmY
MTTTHEPGRELKEAVIAELAWMPSVQAHRVVVSVDDGGVTLSGQVQTYPEKHAAVQAALRMRGIIAVVDEIEVHTEPVPRHDADIARDAHNVLERTLIAPAGSVTAEVTDHVVTLAGSVTWNYQREAISKAISTLPGVHGIYNNITLKPAAIASASEAKTKIATALRRNAALDADRIHVDVLGDKITLTGTVASWAEYSQASHVAWATPGAMHVDNHLRVVV